MAEKPNMRFADDGAIHLALMRPLTGANGVSKQPIDACQDGKRGRGESFLTLKEDELRFHGRFN